jgi:hypothetical protein
VWLPACIRKCDLGGAAAHIFRREGGFWRPRDDGRSGIRDRQAAVGLMTSDPPHKRSRPGHVAQGPADAWMTIPGDPTELISRAMINCVGRGTPAGSSPVSVSLVVGRLSRPTCGRRSALVQSPVAAMFLREAPSRSPPTDEPDRRLSD